MQNVWDEKKWYRSSDYSQKLSLTVLQNCYLVGELTFGAGESTGGVFPSRWMSKFSVIGGGVPPSLPVQEPYHLYCCKRS